MNTPVTRRYDYYVFDLDGTIVDIEQSYITDIFERVGDRVGYSFSETEAVQVWHGLGGPRDLVLDDLGIDPVAFWEVYHDEEDAEARAASTYLYGDAQQISEVREPTVLVTHCQQYLTDVVLDTLDIDDWFDTIVCCTDETGWKPDPYPVQMAMSNAGINNQKYDGVLVGDGPHDIGAAWNAGLDGVHIERHSPTDRGLCVVSDYQLSRIDELF